VHPDLIVPIKDVQLLIILYVLLINANLHIIIVVQMELVFMHIIQYVHPELIVPIINVQLLIILFVLLTNANLDIQIMV